MTTLDPIIGVKDVEASARWYQRVFGFTNKHGGHHFAVLVNLEEEVMLCLHKWGEHEHPTLTDGKLPSGNGLLLYFRTDRMNQIYENALREGATIEEDIHLNPNSLKKEFSFRDPDGYFLTLTEFHRYEG